MRTRGQIGLGRGDIWFLLELPDQARGFVHGCSQLKVPVAGGRGGGGDAKSDQCVGPSLGQAEAAIDYRPEFADRLDDVIGCKHTDNRLRIALADNRCCETNGVERVTSRRFAEKLLRR